MKIVERIKNIFKRGGYALTGQTLDSVLDHPKINMEQKEYERIRNSLDYYEGNYKPISFKNSNGQTRKRQLSTVNMMKKVSAEYAKVIFNEQAEIVVGDANSNKNDVNEWIQHVLEHNDFKKNFSKYLEPAMALGGLVVRPYFDQGTKEIEFSWALADAFYPLQSNTNNISEGALSFLSTKSEGKKTYYYTLLEFHEWVNGNYVITNELYCSEDVTRAGERVALSELYDDLEETATFNANKNTLFSYLKTAGFNNVSPYSPLGLGVCDNCKNTLDRINQTYDEFNMEIRRGKRRIVASEMLLNSRIDESEGRIKQYFDDDEDVFQIMPGANIDDMTIKDLTSDIRTTEYTAAINHHLKTLEMETGLSNGTFTFDGEGIRSTKTATEVVSEQSQTYQSRNMQITQVEKFIKELIIAVCELGKATISDGKSVFSGEIPTETDIGIDFDDGIFVDKNAQKIYYTSMYDKGLLPGYHVLSKLMDLPEDEAKKLYDEAQKDVIEKTVPNYFKSDIEDEEE